MTPRVQPKAAAIFPAHDLAPAVGHALTDCGAAERFAAIHGARWRFDHRRGTWLSWVSHRWAVDTTGAVLRAAVDLVRAEQRAALDIHDMDRKAAVTRFWIRREHRGAVDNLLAIAKNLLPLADAGDRWDIDPWLLGVPNGVMDLRTGELRDGRPEDRITMAAAVPFDPEARCPRFERFIPEIFSDDAELVDFVWRALGYSLTGDMQEQVFLMPYGRGANGKSTLLDTIGALLGDYAYTARFATFEEERPGTVPAEVAALAGRRFVVASEPTGGRLNTSRLKDVTGGEKVNARALYGAPFMFRPACKIWLSVNERPRVPDDSDGLWRRVRLIPFARVFEGAADDRQLKQTLADEAPGILAWLVRGCLEWQSRGLEAPAVVRGATADYRADADPLGDFLAEYCDLRANGETGAADLFRAYEAWAMRAELGERDRLGATAFGRRCAARFLTVRTRRGRRYRGVSVTGVTG